MATSLLYFSSGFAAFASLRAFLLKLKKSALWNDVISDAGGGRLVWMYLLSSFLFLRSLTIDYPLAIKSQYFSTDQANAQRPRTPTIAQGQWPSRELSTGNQCWCYYMFGKVCRAEKRAFWSFSPPKEFLTSFPRSCLLPFCVLSGIMPHTSTDSHVHKAVHKQMWKPTYILIIHVSQIFISPLVCVHLEGGFKKEHFVDSLC